MSEYAITMIVTDERAVVTVIPGKGEEGSFTRTVGIPSGTYSEANYAGLAVKAVVKEFVKGGGRL